MQKLTKLKEEMLRQEVTSLKLCQDLGINSCSFSLYLNGWKRIPRETKKEIAGYLNVSQINCLVIRRNNGFRNQSG